MNVLLIEDDQDTALALELMLRQNGIEVQSARDGRQALAVRDSALREGVAPPDVLVLDLTLADRSSLSLVKEWAALGPLPGIVIYSAAPEGTLRDAARSIGAAAAFRKPCVGSELVEAIENAAQDTATRKQTA